MTARVLRKQKVTRLFGVKLIFPRIRHVVRMLNDLHHQELRIEHPVLFRYHTPCDSQYGTEDSDVEEYGPILSYFEMNDEVGVYNRCEHEDCCERSGYKGDEANHNIN